MPRVAPAARRIMSLDAAPAAASAARIVYGFVNVPLFMGEGDIDYSCARCHQVVCEGMSDGELAGVVVRCSCGAVNSIPPGRGAARP
jgi:hypothetical protein